MNKNILKIKVLQNNHSQYEIRKFSCHSSFIGENK